MNKIYFKTANGNLADNYDLVKAAWITTGERISIDDVDSIKKFAETCKGVGDEIENPSVNYLLKRGFKTQAIKVYRDRHPDLSMKAVFGAINKMEKKINSAKDEDVAEEICEDEEGSETDNDTVNESSE